MENNQHQSRKTFLKRSAAGVVALTAGLGSVGALLESFTPGKEGTGHGRYRFDVSAKQFRDGVMPRAQLSMLASKLAVERTTQADARQFAEWELMEAIAVIDFLKDLGTPVPTPGKEASAFIEKLKKLSGKEFDIEYMKAEQANHEWLRDLAENYLGNADAKKSDGETYRLARVAIFSFTEHVGLSKRINNELNA